MLAVIVEVCVVDILFVVLIVSVEIVLTVEVIETEIVLEIDVVTVVEKEFEEVPEFEELEETVFFVDLDIVRVDEPEAVVVSEGVLLKVPEVVIVVESELEGEFE